MLAIDTDPIGQRPATCKSIVCPSILRRLMRGFGVLRIIIFIETVNKLPIANTCETI